MDTWDEWYQVREEQRERSREERERAKEARQNRARESMRYPEDRVMIG